MVRAGKTALMLFVLTARLAQYRLLHLRYKLVEDKNQYRAVAILKYTLRMRSMHDHASPGNWPDPAQVAKLSVQGRGCLVKHIYDWTAVNR